MGTLGRGRPVIGELGGGDLAGALYEVSRTSREVKRVGGRGTRISWALSGLGKERRSRGGVRRPGELSVVQRRCASFAT